MAATAATVRRFEAPRRRASTPGLLLAGVIGLALLTRYLILDGNGWAQDDNGYLVLAQRQGLSFHWLLSVVSTHWEPAVRAIYSLQNHLMPFDYRWGLLVMLAIVGASLVMFERIMRLLVGGTRAPLLAAGYLGFSVFLIETLQWWTSGIEALPSMLCELICVYAYLRYQGERSGRWVALAAAALAIGLLFYEKTALVLVYIVLLRGLLLSDPRVGLRASSRAFARERSMWLALIGVTLLWVLAFAAAGGLGAGTHGSASSAKWLAFWRVLWVQTIVPGTAGVAFHTSAAGTISSPDMGIAIALQAILAAVVAASIWRRPSAWRLWVVLGVCVVANGLPLGLNRLPALGPQVAAHVRYSLDFAWLTPLLVGAAFFPRSRFPVPTSEPGASPRGVTGPVLAAALAALAAAYLSLSTTSAVRLQREWSGEAARTWESNVQSLAALAHRDGRLVVADNLVPGAIATYATPPSQNDLANVLPHYLGAGINVDGPLIGSLVTVDRIGRPRPASVGPALARFTPPRGSCSQSMTAGSSLSWPLADPPPRSGRYYLSFAYTAPRPATLQLRVDDGIGLLPTPEQFVRIAAGHHVSIGWLGVGAPRGIVLDIPARAACVTKLELVTLKPVR